jgi:hypothetical protein
VGLVESRRSRLATALALASVGVLFLGLGRIGIAMILLAIALGTVVLFVVLEAVAPQPRGTDAEAGRDPARWWEFTTTILLLTAPVTLIYSVLDEPWYIDAPIVLGGQLLALLLSGFLFPRMRADD